MIKIIFLNKSGKNTFRRIRTLTVINRCCIPCTVPLRLLFWFSLCAAANLPHQFPFLLIQQPHSLQKPLLLWSLNPVITDLLPILQPFLVQINYKHLLCSVLKFMMNVSQKQPLPLIIFKIGRAHV